MVAAAAEVPLSIQPADVIANRRWLRRSDPFPHVVADRVFTTDFYNELARAVAELVDSGKLAPLERHDIFGRTLTSETRGPLTFFLSRGWADLLARVFAVSATGFVNCGVHHHAIGSSNGFPHNDVNPGWFIDEAAADGVVLPQPDRCVYTSGQRLDPSAEPVQMVRSVAMLFYVGNGSWQDGDGGETGLYRSGFDPVDRPAATVPPIDNRLLAFECTPMSFHGFIRNNMRPRNSVILWLHRSHEEAMERWGDGAIVPYGRGGR